jgi:hypothetical protein
MIPSPTAPRAQYLLRVCLLRACLLCAALLPAVTLAPSAQAQEAPLKVVLMKVPDGGTLKLRDALRKVPGISLQPEDWFFEEAKKRGLGGQGRKLLVKPKDLGYLMDGAQIEVIVYTERKRGEEGYRVALFTRKDAKPARKFEAEGDEDGLTEAGAETIRAELAGLLGKTKKPEPVEPDPDPIEPDPDPVEPDPVEPDPVDDAEALRQRLIAEQRAKRGASGAPWVFVGAGARFIKRDLGVGGVNGAVLSYRSAFYPGYELTAELYPISLAEQGGTGALGLYLNFVNAFDSVGVIAGDGQPASLGLTQLQFEGGPSWRLDSPLNQGGGSAIQVRLRASVRWASYAIDPNASLPATSQTSIVLAGMVDYPVVFENFFIHGHFEFIPFNIWGTGADQFGQEPSSYGVGTGLGGKVLVNPSFAIQFGYTFNMLRSSFTGTGAADFEGANAFELVQGLQVGIGYQY